MKCRRIFATVVIILIILIIGGFGLYLFSIQKGIKYEDKLIIFISFVGLFSTFGGAFLGALIAGKYSLKAVKEQEKKKQEAIDLKIKNLTTLAIIQIEDEKTYIEQHIRNCIENNDSSSIKNLSTIIGVFSKPLMDIVNSKETFKADKNVYTPILRFMSTCNRLRNYELHSFDYELSLEDNSCRISDYRDVFLKNDESNKRNEFSEDSHPYIAEAFLIYCILEDEFDKLKSLILQKDIYESKGSIEAEINEYRFY